MPMSADLEPLLDDCMRRHRLPGASLSVLADGRVASAARGILNQRTGVTATTGSVFQVGSITKLYTATLLMRLIEQGRARLDSPVAEVLPAFRVADPEVTATVTLRHLLSHTSGLAGDRFVDTGRGDDAVRRCVESYHDLGQDLPLGTRFSYSNSGFVILGAVIEQLTGMSWDEALATELLGPAGLADSHTLPERLLGYRVALGHVGDPPEAAPVWGLPRSLGPAGLLCTTAPDLVRFAALHLAGGRADDGTAVLSAESVAQMHAEQCSLAGLSGTADGWGLGWMRFDWDDRLVIGHDGGTIGQYAYLLVVPDAQVAMALLTNGGMSTDAFRDVARAVLDATCGLRVPDPPAPSGDDSGDAIVGRFTREGTRLEVTRRGGALTAVCEEFDEIDRMASGGRNEFAIRAEDASAGRYLARAPGFLQQGHGWSRIGLFTVDGTEYVHLGSRALRRVER